MGTFAITPTAASYQRPSASNNLPAGPCEEASEAATTIDWRGRISYAAGLTETFWSLGPAQQFCSSAVVNGRPFAGGHVPPFSVFVVAAVEEEWSMQRTALLSPRFAAGETCTAIKFVMVGLPW